MHPRIQRYFPVFPDGNIQSDFQFLPLLLFFSDMLCSANIRYNIHTEDRYAKMVSSFQMSNPPAVPSRSDPVGAPDIPSFHFDQDALLLPYTMDLHFFSIVCMSIQKSRSVVPAVFFLVARLRFVLSYLHLPHAPSDIL